MELAAIAFVALSGLEPLVWLPPFWQSRKLISGFLITGLTITSVALVVESPKGWTIILAFLSLYRIVNLLRLIRGRVQIDYLYHASRRTSLWLIGSQSLGLSIVAVGSRYHVSAAVLFDGLATAQLIGALVLLTSTSRHLKTIAPTPSEAIADRDLPSLTVAIPARNETADLEDCLRSLVASSYPKLEILVLDDCSQSKRTSEIIRGFAQDGVRFIAGKNPPDKWLAKNYAYDQLAKEANGELLLFCGVDARFGEGSLDVLVKTLLQKHKSMLSVLPVNLPPDNWNVSGMLVQPGRYAWELALPRGLLRRPPVLSTCWLITKRALDNAGGFAAASRMAVSESYLARQTASSGDGYSLLRSDESIGVSSLKSLTEQRATAIRTRYPQLHRRPELAALVGLAEFTLLVGSLIILAYALTSQNWLVGTLAVLTYLMETIAYGKIVNLTYRKFLIRGLWLLPIAALYDIGLLNYSMWRYEFREVIWKGRNVCIPVMRVIPALPKIS